MNELVKKEQFRRRKELFDNVGKIVEAYCREYKLIIYGGLAMDKYLKNAGHVGIYDGFETIDYDVYSVNHIEDAERLGKLIHDAGVPHVKIHSGMSPKTRKIHISSLSVSVIDINSVTPEKYMTLNPVTIDGLFYIRTDALFEDQIKNVVTNLFVDYYRIPKIIKRLELLVRYFPVIPSGIPSVIDNTVYKTLTEMEGLTGIIAGDFAYNYYVSGNIGGIPILYSDSDIPTDWPFPYFPMEGETIYEQVGNLKLAPPALLLYFYFKLKISENTSKYDTQIWTLMQFGFPFPNYREVAIYIPKREIVREKYENIPTIWLA